jgi:tetraacyldisaccharide 4'-kinase
VKLNYPDFWQEKTAISYVLLPLTGLFIALTALRRLIYRLGLFNSYKSQLPVIVVGNITVGGSGKTPFVIWLVAHLKKLGYKPGIVSRGYGGKASSWPQQVRVDSDPETVGDEALLLALRCHCPMAVAPKRADAVRALEADGQVDIIISDDGLQHYAMGRDIEIAVVDGVRQQGNGFMLPAGPLREPVSRLDSVDLLITSQAKLRRQHHMEMMEPRIYPITDPQSRQPLSAWDGQQVRAIAGIGDPQRFFDMLRSHGLSVIDMAFPDHHSYQPSDLQFDDAIPLLMTEKDAVKCHPFAPAQTWVVSIDVEPDEPFKHRLSLLLNDVAAEKQTSEED